MYWTAITKEYKYLLNHKVTKRKKAHFPRIDAISRENWYSKSK